MLHKTLQIRFALIWVMPFIRMDTAIYANSYSVTDETIFICTMKPHNKISLCYSTSTYVLRPLLSGRNNTVLIRIYHISKARLCAHIGVVLAFLEKAGAIPPAERDDGSLIPSGIVSAGYQNFILCIEMLLASFALRFAFPVGIYRRETPTCTLLLLRLRYLSSNRGAR